MMMKHEQLLKDQGQVAESERGKIRKQNGKSGHTKTDTYGRAKNKGFTTGCPTNV
jgi:hypothetical protein